MEIRQSVFPKAWQQGAFKSGVHDGAHPVCPDTAVGADAGTCSDALRSVTPLLAALDSIVPYIPRPDRHCRHRSGREFNLDG